MCEVRLKKRMDKKNTWKVFSSKQALELYKFNSAKVLSLNDLVENCILITPGDFKDLRKLVASHLGVNVP